MPADDEHTTASMKKKEKKRVYLSLVMRLWYFVFRKLILQTRIRSHPVGLDV